ncbi:unnamed protein product [Cylindrotheca closterium]|uniref:RCC1-like domain-containing protein n=1 Tax=Cylindrotheca closterium TaxID=2856 RepID=A0AAD2C9T5_9STRA|nr:unnamed protein product [Cylindrotheca closterium]
MPSADAPLLVGFGANYFRNMGPAKRVSLRHDESTKIKAYVLEAGNAPWDEQDDTLLSVDTTASATVFLTRGGKIYMSGTMHGRIETPITRTIIPLPLKCVEISCGRHFGLARMEGGLAVCSWGAGHFGQLGLGHDSAPCINHPTVIESLLPHVVGAPIKGICAGYWHAMALTEAGEIYSWGCNRNSQCGMKPTKDPPTLTAPQRVRFELQRTNPKIVKLSAGRSHSVALDDKGAVYCWGSCSFGQCGPVGRRRGGTAPPKQVEALTQVQIVDIAAGDAHTLSLTGGGRVFGWGGGFEGQLGIGSIIQLNPKPKLVADLDFVALQANREFKSQQSGGSSSELGVHDRLAKVAKVLSIHASGNSSYATSSAGHVYSWGCNDVESLGLPKLDPSKLVYAEPGLPLPTGTSIKSGHTHSFDSSHNVALPKRVDCLQDMHITHISASPTFLWCIGTKRVDEDKPVNSFSMESRSISSVSIEEPRSPTASVTSKKSAASKMSGASSTRGRPPQSPRMPSGQDPPGPVNSPINSDNETTTRAEESTINDSYDEGSTSRHSAGVLSSERSKSNRNPKTLEDSKMSFDTSSKSLGNVSEGSGGEAKSPSKAKKIFSKKSFKKGVAKFARRASHGAFGKTSESLEGENQKKPKRRSFFGGS